MKRIYYLLTLSLIWSYALSMRADDSIPATNLEELVVKSERSWIENGVVNLIPSKKEKQLSTSPGTLIKIMNLPMLKGDGDAITTSAGEPVAIYINGEPATRADLATFWPKNVKKVEYMINPTGGQYTGKGYVVNFVVADYAVGGVTRISAKQAVPLVGNYGISSKLNYKRMSYGLLLNLRDERTSPDKIYEEATYNDIFYNGLSYDKIIQTSTGEVDNKYTDLNFAFNAKYTHKYFRATHTFGLKWRRDSKDRTSQSIWSEDLFSSDSYDSYTKSKSLSPQIAGDYYLGLSPKWSIGGHWDYAFSSNDNIDWSQFGYNPRVENNIKEKVNTFTVNAYANYYLSKKLIFQLLVSSTNKWFSSDYTGSNDGHYNQYREELTAKLSAYWYPTNTLSFVLAPGIIQSTYKFADMTVRHIQPSASLYGTWNLNRKIMMSGQVATIMTPATAGETNPVITQVSDLLWQSGNPQLKPQFFLLASYSFLYMPLNWLSLSPGISYNYYRNVPFFLYEVAPEGMGGVIQMNANAPGRSSLNTSLDISFYLLNNKLSITASPRVRHFKSEGVFARSLTELSLNANVGYKIGNCYIDAYYQTKNKSLSASGDAIYSQADQFSIGCTYSLNDWNISLNFNNIFHSRFKTRSEDLSDVYAVNSYRAASGGGRGVSLGIIYTFGYGKKVEKVFDIQEPSDVESSRHSSSK